MPQGIILDLCAGTGAWSEPYRQAGYDVRRVDLANNGQDVRLIKPPNGEVRGILCAPPCTDLARSGARWWRSKGEQALFDALAIADACMRLVALCDPDWWALENPSGRLKHYYGPPKLIFQPWHYGDAYTKQTCLWGYLLLLKNLRNFVKTSTI